MIRSKQELRFYIAADRIMRGLPARRNPIQWLREAVVRDNIARYLRSMRILCYYECGKQNRGGGLRYIYHKLRFRRLGERLGFTIGTQCFGYGLVIPHYGTIVVNGGVRAGNFCVLHTSTCIAGSGKTIGDGLYLSAGSVRTGTWTMGDHVTVAAHSLVNDRAEGACGVLLAGSPAQAKRPSPPWWERDHFTARVEEVERLKRHMLDCTEGANP